MNPRENEKFNKLGFLSRSIKKENGIATSVKYIFSPFFLFNRNKAIGINLPKL